MKLSEILKRIATGQYSQGETLVSKEGIRFDFLPGGFLKMQAGDEVRTLRLLSQPG